MKLFLQLPQLCCLTGRRKAASLKKMLKRELELKKDKEREKSEKKKKRNARRGITCMEHIG